MDDDMHEIVIGFADREHLRIRTTALDSEDWRAARVDVRVGAFTARIENSFYMGELAEFRIGLQAIAERLVGEAHLRTTENWLSLCLTGNRLGHCSVTGWIRDKADGGNRLELTLPQLDQTFLETLVRQIRAIE
jgi:hypothetical protein